MEISPAGYWIAAVVAVVLALWTVAATVVYLVRGRGPRLVVDVWLAAVFAGGAVMLALWFAHLARGAGGG
jgi:hypothetical protein